MYEEKIEQLKKLLKRAGSKVSAFKPNGAEFSNYVFEFGQAISKAELADPRAFEDFFDPEITHGDESVFTECRMFKYNDDNDYRTYLEMAKKHILMITYDDMFKAEIGIVLDGKYKDEVVYLSNEGGAWIFLTHMNFLDWLIGFYAHVLDGEPGRYISF